MQRKNTRKMQVLAAATALASISSIAGAVDYSWMPFTGGTYLWTDANNWDPVGVPNSNLDSANLSGPVTGSNLLVNLPSDISVAILRMGATGSPFTTNIGSTGGKLILDFGSGTATLDSIGSAGSTNVISAPVQLGAGTANNLQFRVTGTNNINFAGGLTPFMDNVGTAALARSLTLANGAYTTGTFNNGTQILATATLAMGTTRIGNIQLAQAGALQNGTLLITGVGTMAAVEVPPTSSTA
jgi:hypothetical protein